MIRFSSRLILKVARFNPYSPRYLGIVTVSSCSTFTNVLAPTPSGIWNTSFPANGFSTIKPPRSSSYSTLGFITSSSTVHTLNPNVISSGSAPGIVRLPPSFTCTSVSSSNNSTAAYLANTLTTPGSIPIQITAMFPRSFHFSWRSKLYLVIGSV